MWANIKGWPYQVSTKGEVRRFDCSILSPALDRGYPVVTLSDGNRKKNFLVHSLVANAFLGERPSKNHQVAHWDGVKTNNVINNLRWATPKENDLDKKRHGTHVKGMGVVQHKLSEEDVVNILKDPRSAHELSKIFGVAASTICRARNNKTWKHLPFVEQPRRRKSGKYTKEDRIYIDDVIAKLGE